MEATGEAPLPIGAVPARSGTAPFAAAATEIARRSRRAQLNSLFSRVFLEYSACFMIYYLASQNAWLNLIRPSLGCPLRGYNEPGGYDQP